MEKHQPLGQSQTFQVGHWVPTPRTPVVQSDSMATLTFVVCPLCVYVCALPSSIFTWQPLPISCVGNGCQVYYYNL